MKRIIACLLASVFSVAVFADTVQDVTGGADLSVRNVGGTVEVSGLGTTASTALPPSTLVKVTKAANTLVATVPTGTLFAGSGISTNLTFTGAADGTPGEINWTVTDPSAIGQTFTVTYQGTPVSVKVTGVSGNIYTIGTHVVSPVFDSFDSIYRGTSIAMDPIWPNTITINGTADGAIPVTITFHPTFAGLGGEKVTQFVNHVLLSTPTVVSGQTYTGTVYLESAVSTATTVSLASNLSLTGTVTVAAGQSSAPFSFTVATIYSTTPSYLHAIAFGTIADEPITAIPLLASITVNTAIPVAGLPVQFTVNLNAKAPTGGLVVKITSDDQNLTVPSTVTVPAGATTVSFTGNPVVVQTNTSATGLTETYISGQYGQTIVRSAVNLH